MAIIEALLPECKLRVRKLYRPEDTSLSDDTASRFDYNCLFWSTEHAQVEQRHVEGRCFLLPKCLITSNLDEWRNCGPHRFYVADAYNETTSEFSPLPQSVLQRFEDVDENAGSYKRLSRPLWLLDIFAGCGGLSIGLQDSGVARCHWAIENHPPAAAAFQKNHPKWYGSSL